MTAEDGMTQAWFVTVAGQLSGGAAAANEAMRYVWWARPLTYLYQLPGLKQVQDWAYRWVARNRYRMPGATDACAIDSKNNKQM